MNSVSVRERQVALVTGSRKGIGRYLVEHLASKGMLVEGCSREPADWHHQDYQHHLADVADEAQVKTMLADIWHRHQRLDIVINNAGIASMNHVVLTPADTAGRIMDVNFFGTFLVCRESAKLMMRRRYGRIVNLGSVATPMRLAGESVYAASKAAVVTFSQTLARELADFGITCNVVAPTPIETDLVRSVPREKLQRIIDSLAIRRFGTCADVAHVVDFFIDPCSDYITGQVITLGGA
jgi:3-oxoacyl-[acyl-carrier protein] reductase